MADKPVAQPSFWDCVHPLALPKPRSLEEGWSYSPRWRFEQVYQYALKYHAAQVEGQPYAPPASETDQWILDFYSVVAFGLCHNPALRWILDAEKSNPGRYGASMLKALVISGMSREDIGKYMHITNSEITAFMKIFFDIEAYLNDRPYIASLVFNHSAVEVEALSPWQSRERTWMAVAFITGETGLRMFLEKTVDYDAAEVARLQDLMYKCMLSSATDYVVGVRANALPRPCDMDRYMQLKQVNSIAEANQQNQGIGATAFAEALMGLIHEEGGVIETLAGIITETQSSSRNLSRLAGPPGFIGEATIVSQTSAENYFGSEKAMQSGPKTITFPHSL